MPALVIGPGRSRDILRGQLQHLIRTAETHADTVEIRVLPFTSPGCNILGASPFHLLTFASPRLPMLAWQESVLSAGIVEDENHVRDASLAQTEALQFCLSREDSLDLVAQYAKELT